ncbi:MAG: D-alanyl-D-alanine carboxypeptidase/D-alanyl-D-alanine-endopeptidase [Ignavibacteriaceae bacterium]
MKRLFVLVFLSLIMTGFGQEVRFDTIPKYSFSTVAEFREQLEDIFNDPNFNNANWGVVIQSLSTGEYFYKRNENKLIMPASNMKLFTTAAGLVQLGGDYRFQTEIYANGTIDGTVLKGNLIVKGFGDPAISGRFYNDDFTAIFRDWADSLLEMGIDEIRGNIIGDDNAFEDRGLGAGWSWDYESDWFAAPSGALSLNDNCVDLVISPSKVGQTANLEIMPETKYVVIVNNVTTVKKDSVTSIYATRDRGTNIIRISGTITEKSSQVKRFVTVNNPTQFFVVVLKEVLAKKGIKVTGFATDIDDADAEIDYEKTNLLFKHYSPTLRELVRVINKSSQNFFAEQLLKTIGYEKNGYGSASSGIKTESRTIEAMGINVDGMSIMDGSGLSRLNMVTPMQIVSLLNFMYKGDQFNDFYNSLPIAGVDGSLANRMRKARTQNNVRAKTGYIGGVRSLSGYVYTGDKELIAFSMIVNNYTVPSVLADVLQDLVCLRLANFKRKQTE